MSWVALFSVGGIFGGVGLLVRPVLSWRGHFGRNVVHLCGVALFFLVEAEVVAILWERPW